MSHLFEAAFRFSFTKSPRALFLAARPPAIQGPPIAALAGNLHGQALGF